MLEVITIKEVKRKIGRWCWKKRTEYAISQDNLAHALDMSRVTIQQLEKGNNVTLDTLLKVANHFNSLPEIYRFFEQEVDRPGTLY